MVKLFRSDRPILLLALFLLGLLFWIPAFFSDHHTIQHLYLPFVPSSFWNSSFIQIAIGFIINFISAFVINKTAERYRLLSKNSHLTGFCFLLFSNAFIELNLVSIIAVNNLLCILFLYRLLDLPSSISPKSVLFDSFFLIGVMGLVYAPYLLLIIPGTIGILQFRAFYLTDWITGLLGLAIPFIYFLSFLFLNGTPFEVPKFVMSVDSPSFKMSSGIYILIGAGVLFLFSSYSYVHQFGRNIAVVRKSLNMNLILLLTLICLGIIFLQSPYLLLSTCAIPLSLFTSIFLTEVKRVWIADLCIGAMFMAIAFHIYMIQ